MSSNTGALVSRRYELDWLRVMAILAIFLYHSMRFFDTMDWHVKSSSTYPSVDLVGAFFATWMMPLIFVVSGASTWYAIAKGLPGKFLTDRVLRLPAALDISGWWGGNDGMGCLPIHDSG